MFSAKRLRKIGLEWLAPLAGVVALALAVYFLFFQRGEGRHRLTMTAGSTTGLRHDLAEMLREEVRGRGIEVELRGSKGSDEALDLVNTRQLDLALVQGGLGVGDRHNVRQVAPLHLEPLHLLVKKDLFADVSKNLVALKGKTINLGEPGSGTHALALEFLEFVGLRPAVGAGAGDYTLSTLSPQQLREETDLARLPDAVFLVSTLPAPVAKHLIARQEYRLVALPFGQAFALDALTREDRARRQQGGRNDVEKGHIQAATIPAYTYSVEPAVPAEDIATLGTRLLLVAHKDTDAAAINHFLDAVFATQFAQLAKPPLEPKLLELPPEFPLHAGTQGYLDRNKPVIAGDMVDFTEKGVSITAAVAGGVFFLWQWFRHRARRRRDLGFRTYIKKVTDIERQAFQLERSPTLVLKELLVLQEQLSALKAEALERFAQGELEGEELMTGFLTQVNDARNYVTRLLLHQRDNLEEQAASQGQSLAKVWGNAVGANDGSAKPRPAGSETSSP